MSRARTPALRPTVPPPRSTAWIRSVQAAGTEAAVLQPWQPGASSAAPWGALLLGRGWDPRAPRHL